MVTGASTAGGKGRKNVGHQVGSGVVVKASPSQIRRIPTYCTAPDGFSPPHDDGAISAPPHSSSQSACSLLDPAILPFVVQSLHLDPQSSIHPPWSSIAMTGRKRSLDSWQHAHGLQPGCLRLGTAVHHSAHGRCPPVQPCSLRMSTSPSRWSFGTIRRLSLPGGLVIFYPHLTKVLA